MPDWESYDKRDDIPTPWPRFCNYFAVEGLLDVKEGLIMSGISLGTVKNTWSMYKGGAHIQYSQSMVDMWRDGIKAMHTQDQAAQSNEEKLVEAFGRTLFFGKEAPGLNLSNTRTELEQGHRNAFNLRWILAEQTAIRSMHRRFFTTDDGRMGIGPNTIRPGDKVAAFLGSAMPFVIVPCHNTPHGVQPDQSYRLRGGCYVDGAMALEPFLGALPSGQKTFWKDGLLYLEDSGIPGHGIEDPRLERLEAGFEGYREWLGKGHPRPLISTTAEQWQSIGVNIERFTLL